MTTTTKVTASPPAKKRPVVVLGVGAAVVLVGAVYWVLHRGVETTDDAQIDGDIVAVPARIASTVAKISLVENSPVKRGDLLVELDADQVTARLAEAEANLAAARANAEAAEADARVIETNAKGNRSVAKASLQGAVVSVSATKEQIAEGRAAVASATASFKKAEMDLTRAKQLFATKVIAQAALDQTQAGFETATAALDQARARLATLEASSSQAQSQVEVANAKLEQASQVDVVVAQARAKAAAARAQAALMEAARDLAALDVAHTKIVAPVDGVVTKRTVNLGQMVQPGQAVVQIVPTSDVWVTGNFKETQLGSLRVGAPAEIHVDAYPGRSLTGHVDSVSPATGAKFSLLPPDNATGNYTKVVQRVPVRVKLDAPPTELPLRPGMSVELSVDTRKHDG